MPTCKYRFNIGKTQAAEIARNKDKIRTKWLSGINVNQKKSFLRTEGFNIDRLCYEWFSRARSQNIPVSGSLVKAKAKEIAEQSGYNSFTASDGWLQKWRKRHNVSFKCISGEAADVNQEDVNQFLEKLPSMLLGYKPDDIYNADESGLFFRALPDKTLAFKSQKCTGGKLSKERLTLLFCVSMTGQKEELLVIGKAKRPRAFKNITTADLPAIWKSNKKAWMTRDIMTEWLLQLDKKMGYQKRKIVLFLDNAGSHPHDLHLKNVKQIFLPPNTTSICQPLDQGVIQNFKFHYRSLILKHTLSSMGGVDSASELSKSIDVLEALYFIKASWDKVTSSTIKNCFSKAGFKKGEINGSEFDPEDDLPLSVLVDLFRGIKQLVPSENQGVENFITIDKNVETEDGNVDIKSIIDLENENDDNTSETEDEVLVTGEDSSKINSYNEALNLVGILKRFARDDFVAFQHIKNLESHFQSRFLQQKFTRLRQTSIVSFFQTGN